MDEREPDLKAIPEVAIASILQEEQDPEQKRQLMVLYSLVLRIARESAEHKVMGMDAKRMAHTVLKSEHDQFTVACLMVKNQTAIGRLLDVLAANFPELDFRGFKERYKHSQRQREKHTVSPLEELEDLIAMEQDPTLRGQLEEFAEEALKLAQLYAKRGEGKGFGHKKSTKRDIAALKAAYVNSVRKPADLKRILELLAVAHRNLDFKTIIRLFEK